MYIITIRKNQKGFGSFLVATLNHFFEDYVLLAQIRITTTNYYCTTFFSKSKILFYLAFEKMNKIVSNRKIKKNVEIDIKLNT